MHAVTVFFSNENSKMIILIVTAVLAGLSYEQNKYLLRWLSNQGSEF
jgi:hypothetical protein